MAKRRPNEVRFTRSARAPFFLAAGVTLVLLSAWLFLGAWSGSYEDSKGKPLDWSPWWALLPFAAGLGTLELARLLSRRAYVLVNAIAIEIFPLFGAPKGMLVFPWPEVSEVKFEENTESMRVHVDDEAKCISLKPIARHQRVLLQRAIEGRMEECGHREAE